MAFVVLQLLQLLPFVVSTLSETDGNLLDSPVGRDSEWERIYDRSASLNNNDFEEYNDSPPRPVENRVWRGPGIDLGQITGVTVDSTGWPMIFTRRGRTWDFETFDDNFRYLEGFLGPIAGQTVFTLNPMNGEIVDAWGENAFYLPHGIHVDPHDNIWLTDVALHQVFKFRRDSRMPELILGRRFEPGSDHLHFCQPTSVAVAPTGEVVVADGYCNSRIMVFDPVGGLLEVIPRPGEFLPLRVPHDLTIRQPKGDVCVADREDARVLCLGRGLPLAIRHPELGRVFAVASYGNYVYAVNGPTSSEIPVKGFTLDPEVGGIVGRWGPISGVFKQPHGIAVCPNGTALYVVEIGPNRVWKFDLVRTNLKM